MGGNIGEMETRKMKAEKKGKVGKRQGKENIKEKNQGNERKEGIRRGRKAKVRGKEGKHGTKGEM